MVDVILVDELDNQVGVMEKLKAHEEGVLHRAYSIFLFNDKGELLLQQRNHDKYHSGGLWTNTCCSHPKPGETIKEGALKRLQEEMGISAPINFAFSFIYQVDFENGLTENEFDHVFIGEFKDDPVPNPEEVADWRYTSIEDIKTEMSLNPEAFTEWFKIALPMVEEYLSKESSLLIRA